MLRCWIFSLMTSLTWDGAVETEYVDKRRANPLCTHMQTTSHRSASTDTHELTNNQRGWVYMFTPHDQDFNYIPNYGRQQYASRQKSATCKWQFPWINSNIFSWTSRHLYSPWWQNYSGSLEERGVPATICTSFMNTSGLWLMHVSHFKFSAGQMLPYLDLLKSAYKNTVIF